MPIAKDTDARWKENEISVFKRYSDGYITTHSQSTWGVRCGLYHRFVNDKRMYLPLILCGPIQIGFTMHDTFVVARHNWIFLGRNGRIWRLENVRLPRKPPYIGDLAREGMIVWADTVARMIVDRLTPHQISEPLSQANQRYRHICKQLVTKRVMDAASLGRKRSMDYFASGISPDWTKSDLATPRIPTVQHAVLLCLVLALDSETASDVIELAAFCEHKLPLYNRQACLSIYQSSVELLAKLCPAWWSQSYLCPWEQVGSIEQLFKAQFCRIINDTWTRELPVEAVVGLNVDIDSNPVTDQMTDTSGKPIPEWGYKAEDYSDVLENEEWEESEDSSQG